MARMRKKKKEDEKLWAEHLASEREHLKKVYQKNKEKWTDHEQKIQREKTLAKVRKHREKKKLEISNGSSQSRTKGSYKSPQTFGKAVKKVFGVLPKSPGKCKAVIKEVVKRNFEPSTFKKLFTEEKPIRKERLDKKLARDFFCSDDISRQAPGKRDVNMLCLTCFLFIA